MIVASIETWKKNVYIQSDDDDFLHKVTRRNKISSVQCSWEDLCNGLGSVLSGMGV